MMTSLGLKVSARAIATDCCWPPESWPVIWATEGIRAPSRAIIASASRRMRFESMSLTPRTDRVSSRPRKILEATSRIRASARSW